MSILPVIAACRDCKRGYVLVNWQLRSRCHACGGALSPIEPVPNNQPFVRGPFVVDPKFKIGEPRSGGEKP